MGWLVAALLALVVALFTEDGTRSLFEFIAFLFGLAAVRTRIRKGKTRPHSVNEY